MSSDPAGTPAESTCPAGQPVHEDLADRVGDPGEPRAECVLCREPTDYPASRPGVTLCPVCEWQEAQRTACSG